MKASSFLRLLRCSLIVCGLGLVSLQAEMRTITDKQGRSIKVDVISVENGKVKIKREDGQLFDLPLASLSEEDQKALTAWAAANPPMLKPNELLLEFSRGKFGTEKEMQSGGAVAAFKDQWGYSLTLSNKSSRALSTLRAEYVLFVKQDQGPGNSDSGSKFRRVKKRSEIDTIPIHESINFRTETVASYRYVLQPGFVWAGSGSNKPIKDTLHGMWLRIYDGDQLVLEKITPEDLLKTEKW